jgi:Na+/H+-dicarboxylate symporter
MLKAVNVPVEGIALILGINRILGTIRTAVNITGDAAVLVAINQL